MINSKKWWQAVAIVLVCAIPIRGFVWGARLAERWSGVGHE